MARRRLSKTHKSLIRLVLGVAILASVIALASLPRTSPDYHRNAQEFLKSGQYAEALQSLDQTLAAIEQEFTGHELKTRQADLLAERGACNLELNRPEHALNDFREARSMQPGNYLRWLREGEAYLRIARFEDAALVYQEASVAFPDREKFFQYAAGCAFYQESQALLNEAIEILTPYVRTTETGFAEDIRGAIAGIRDFQRTRETHLTPPFTAPDRQAAWIQLERARSHFARAESLLADYHAFAGLEPNAGRLRARMLYEAGRMYEMKRLIEVLLRLSPEIDLEIELTQLLANSLYKMGAYEEAARLFAGMKKVLQRERRGLESRRAGFFAAEAQLRAGNGAAALEQLDQEAIITDTNITNLFYVGWARHLSNQNNALYPLERATELLDLIDFGRGNWFRDEEHRSWILHGLATGLTDGGRYELALVVIQAAADLMPDEPEWVRKECDLLRRIGGREQEVAEQSFAILASGIRRDADFAQWRSDYRQLDQWKEIQEEISYNASHVLSRFSRTTRNPREANSPERLMVQQEVKRDDRMGNSLLRARSSSLLGELVERPSVAMEVYDELIRQDHRQQAYLFMFGLADAYRDVPHFRYQTARHDYSDGRAELAADTFAELYRADSTDFQGALWSWMLYQETGQLDQARQLEVLALDQDPDGVGRFLAAIGALRAGFRDLAVDIGAAAPPTNATSIAANAVSLLAEMDLDPKIDTFERAVSLTELGPSNPVAILAMLLSADRLATQQALDLVLEIEPQLNQVTIEGLLFIGTELYRRGKFALAERILVLALDQDPAHIPARITLVDSLVARGRLNEADSHLDYVDQRLGVPEARRRALVLLLRDGATAAYEYLRQAQTVSTNKEPLTRWVALTASASGRLEIGIRATDPKEPLSPDQVRFLALQFAVRQLPPSAANANPEVSAKLKQVAQPDDGTERDRELERWLSLELQDGEQTKLSDQLLPILLLQEFAALRPIAETLERHVIDHFPSLGPLVRQEARKHYENRSQAEAMELLVRMLEQDPSDSATLDLLVSWSAWLTSNQVERIYEQSQRMSLDPGTQALITGLYSSARGESTQALTNLLKAQETLDDPSPARLAILRLYERELLRLIAEPHPVSPYYALGERNRGIELATAFEQQVLQTLAQAPNDPTLLQYLTDYLESQFRTAASLDQLKYAVVESLSTKPQPLWHTYEIAARILATTEFPQDLLSKVAISLQLALKQFPRCSSYV